MLYIFNLLTIIGIFSILALGLNLIAGTTGLLSCCQAAFFAIGAYSSALLSMKIGLPYPIVILAVVAITGIFGYAIGFPSIQFKGDYLALGTIAFGEIINVILNNWVTLTEGPTGIIDIPSPSIFFLRINSVFDYFLLTWLLVGITVLIIRQIEVSHFGRLLFAIKNDELAALSIGVNVKKYKLLSFVIGSTVAGIGGSVYAHYLTYIDPGSFLISESILLLAMIVLGGLGNVLGSIIGVAILIVIPESLRFLGLPAGLAGNLRQMLYGLIIIVMIIFRPEGIIPKKKITL